MTLKKDRAPLYERLVEHHESAKVSFHVPGHKCGHGLEPYARKYMQQVMAIDYTEITGLDDLYQAEDVIREAQLLAADCFGAEETYFLVNGSTVGNLAMILTVCERGDLVLVQRNVHKSIIHGLMLAGVHTVFLPPHWDEASALVTGIRYADVQQCLEQYPHAKALIISNPNYYGMGIDIRPVVELMHNAGKPVLVDEAHGAHYGFHPSLPRSALADGADIVVQSTHKMLTAMTMGAMLHVQGDLIHRELLQQRISMLQTSSPSYPILASLDLSRRLLHTQGAAAFEHGLGLVDTFRRRLLELDTFGVIEPPMVRRNNFDSAYTSKDPFKVAVYDMTGTLSGLDLQQRLEEHGCMVEMSDLRYVLLVFTLATSGEDVERLMKALGQIRQDIVEFPRNKPRYMLNDAQASFEPFQQISEPVMMDLSMHGIYGSVSPTTKVIPLAQSVGKVAAEMVIPYPPGIPVLYPGERIPEGIAQYLIQLHQHGARFHLARKTVEPMIRIFDTFCRDLLDV